MRWWEAYFGGEDFLRLEGAPEQGDVDRVVDFLCETLDLRAGSRVLDVGCGMGRHALALARRGCVVTGIDASPYMVDESRRYAGGEDGVEVRQLDFHEMTFAADFDAVVCLGNTLGFDRRDDDVAAVRRMADALVAGGRLCVELHNLAWYRVNLPGRTWWEEPGAFVLSEVTYDEAERRLVTRDVVVPTDGTPPREYAMSLLHYNPSEIEGLLAAAGLSEITFYGDAGGDEGGPAFSREGYNDRSREMVVTARRSAD